MKSSQRKFATQPVWAKKWPTASIVTFQQIGGFELDPVNMALFGQKAENDYVGVSTGILDQYSSAMGKAGNTLELDCRDLTSKDIRIADDCASSSVTPVPSASW